ncbi:FG-GAP-like repeat-containing protein [Hymenobacter sp. 15J16-1T3B]|uniref:FG-GAP-like repeat-containing protein n=1 Tax=Hymenobacter sp. 15J16-1T3B TaxID=2886941 RepID=UPI001D126634|nr:FG-GAP-like repeat-containing protein [Hymenobacter sp. 15J16-1T3B]MCC3157975.1 FG-GAP-like repeat-containing protein [Hymenobacter sp. 15J16-1T3B]
MNAILLTGARPLTQAGFAAALLLHGAALAQGPTIVSTSPVRNAIHVPAGAGVGLTFSQAVSAGSAANVRVFGDQRRGLRPAAVSGGGTSSLLVQPQQPFAPGEEISVTVPAAVQGTSGAAATPYVYRFTAAVSGGSTSFNGTANPHMPGYYRSMRLADFNQDGNLDLLTADAQGASLVLSAGDGRGNFGNVSSPVSVTVGTNPDYVVPADMNNDGKLDAVVTCSGGANRTIVVRLGNGMGGFSNTQTTSIIPTATPAIGLAVADVNGDGNLDVLTTNGAALPTTVATRTVSVRLGDGAGNLTGTTDLPIGPNNCALAVGDVNNDGKMDLVLADLVLNTLQARLGDGSGDFAPAGTPVAVGGRPVSLVLTDFNSDGLLDVATANGADNTVSVSLGNGTGSFAAATTLPLVGRTPVKLVAADVDGDGDMDLLVANNGSTGTGPTVNDGVNVLVNSGTGSFTAAPAVGIDRGPIEMAVGDVNNDGALDFVTSNTYNFSMSIRFNLRVLATRAARPELAVAVYPNPARDEFRLDVPAAAGAVSVQLLNGLGQVVRSYAPAPGNRPLTLAGLPAGLYAVRVSSPAGVATRQLVVR